MPKKSSNKSNWGGRGGGRPVNPEEKHYFGHDDRVGSRNDGGTVFVGNRPRVSFKAQTKPGKEKHRHLDLALKQHLDDDIQMNAGSNNNGRQVVLRGRGRGNYNSASRMRGRNSPLPQRMSNKFSRPVPLALADNSWYKVTIPYGFKYPKEFVLRNLMTHIAPDAFVPIMYKVTAKEASFFVDNAVTASKLQKSDNQITTNDGFRLQVRVRPGAPPTCEMNDAMKERLKQAMTKRYLVESNALDLSRFHLDPELADDYFCPLFKPIMLMTVLDIVATHIPNLEALNLDGNKLQAIDRLSVLKWKFEKLKILHIGDNRLREINQIDSIKDLKLEELRLEGNPLCNKYKSRQTEYVSSNIDPKSKREKSRLDSAVHWRGSFGKLGVSLTYVFLLEFEAVLELFDKGIINISLYVTGLHAVRKRFPKLLRLDGVVLPRPIMFDVADEGVKLPPSQRIFVANPKAQEIASQFLQQYFMIFDSESRQPLLDAYHEHSCFSMTIASVLSANKPSGYLSENRNLYRLNDTNKRRKLLKLGRLPVVSFISEIPPTKHDLNSFTMDLSLATEGMMIITVAGLFKELDAKETLRFFNRTFVIVPQGSGYCIRNEQLHIGNPTDLQEKRAFSPIANEVSVSAPPAGPSNVPPPYLEPSEEIKHNMFVALSQQTNMNAEWSRKCLEEVQWNFNNALAAFQEFFKHGQIPPEAFQK